MLNKKEGALVKSSLHYLMVYKKVKLLDIASIERASNKEYCPGVTVVQVSATSGQVEYVDEARMIESKYVVLKPYDKIESKYFYFSVKNSADEFFYKFKAGLNVQIEDFKHMELYIEDDIDIQKEQVRNMEKIKRATLLSEQEINEVKEFKNTMLSKMFL